MTVEITPVGLSTLSYQFYIIWAAMNIVLIFPCVYFFFPETKGLSLEKIDEIFVESKNVFQPVWVAKRLIKGERVSGGDEKAKENGVENGIADEKDDRDGIQVEQAE
jgi:hypothetical protein